ncbi:MAG: SRPBCC family protein [Ignavibacteria bacterium]|nr:SRPBCC family protein [Ignavibacteria bacterium]
MTHIKHSITIEAPVDQVFNYAADYRKWSEWFEGVSDFKLTTQITQGNGARYAYKARVMGLSAPVETEIHDFVQNRGWTGISTKGLAHRTRWSFEPSGNGTKFTYAMEYQLPVPLLGSLLDSLFARPQWRKILERSLNNLRQHFVSSSGTPAH